MVNPRTCSRLEKLRFDCRRERRLAYVCLESLREEYTAVH